MMLQSEEIINRFTELMKTFWNDYNIDCWNHNKAFTSFKGTDIILALISNIPQVVQFIKTTFTPSDYLDTICESFTLWAALSKFIHIHQIPDEALYIVELEQFEKNVVSFYECGRKTF
eukprot:scaffold267060_cov35-Attheya_sp.AAC.1